MTSRFAVAGAFALAILIGFSVLTIGGIAGWFSTPASADGNQPNPVSTARSGRQTPTARDVYLTPMPTQSPGLLPAPNATPGIDGGNFNRGDDHKRYGDDDDDDRGKRHGGHGKYDDDDDDDDDDDHGKRRHGDDDDDRRKGKYDEDDDDRYDD